MRNESAMGVNESLETASIELVHDDDGRWRFSMPGLPISGDVRFRPQVEDAVIVALRRYAKEWADQLHEAPGNAWLVKKVQGAHYGKMLAWLRELQLGGAESAAAAAIVLEVADIVEMDGKRLSEDAQERIYQMIIKTPREG